MGQGPQEPQEPWPYGPVEPWLCDDQVALLNAVDAQLCGTKAGTDAWCFRFCFTLQILLANNNCKLY